MWDNDAMSHHQSASGLNYDLLHPAYVKIRQLLPATPSRYSATSVSSSLESDCPATKVAMPWVWAYTLGDEIKIGVNATRVAAVLAAEGPAEVRARLGDYTEILTVLIQEDLAKAIDAQNSIATQVFDQPVLDMPKPSPDHAAMVRQAAANAGMNLAQFHSTILKRTLH